MNVNDSCELDDDHPKWLVNAQITGLLEGDGAPEDHDNVKRFLLDAGLPAGTVDRTHRAIVNAEHPIDMVLHCPSCHTQHIDAPDDSRGPIKCQRTPMCSEPCGEWCGWTNPPHRSHLCHQCGTIWRPADVCTNGVTRIATRGKHDTWGPA